MTVVHEYAAAKSNADVEAALAVCTDGFRLETVPFQLTAEGKHEARAALGAFFHAFPDYEVTLEGTADSADGAAAWGTIRATMWGDFLNQKATGRGFELPMMCVFAVEGGRIA